MSYPLFAAEEMIELLADWRMPIDQVLTKLRLNRREMKAQLSSVNLVHRIMHEHEPAQFARLVLADAIAWKAASGQSLPKGYVVAVLDGDSSNLQLGNLYCMPRSQFLKWVRFLRYPVEAHVDRLEQEIMALDTSDAIKKELLKVLEHLVDPNQRPDYMRQRAICDTVQTLIGLLKVEVTYMRAIDGDAVIPLLEGAHQESLKRQEMTRKSLLTAGPGPGHPWRGLGNRS